METGVRSHQGEVFVHPLSNPGAAGICPDMLEVAEEANRAGDFSLAVEIYSSQLADLQQPDRGLCLRKADSLARAGRISEALESYCSAAGLGNLQPHELSLLVETIGKSLREKELGTINGHSNNGGGDDGGECQKYPCVFGLSQNFFVFLSHSFPQKYTSHLGHVGTFYEECKNVIFKFFHCHIFSVQSF